MAARFHVYRATICTRVRCAPALCVDAKTTPLIAHIVHRNTEAQQAQACPLQKLGCLDLPTTSSFTAEIRTQETDDCRPGVQD